MRHEQQAPHSLAVLKDGSAGVCVCVWKINKCSRTCVVCKHTQKYCGAAEEYAFCPGQVHIHVFFYACAEDNAKATQNMCELSLLWGHGISIFSEDSKMAVFLPSFMFAPSF